MKQKHLIEDIHKDTKSCLKQNITAYTSRKLKVLSFMAIICVIYIHTYIRNAACFPLFSFVQDLVGYNFCQVFCPLFFGISGYLFFLGFDGSYTGFIKKYRSRFKTLVIPYLLWNVFFMIQMLILKYNPVTGPAIHQDYLDLFSSGLGQCLYTLFIEPAGYQLWFLRDLIVIVCFTPVIWFINRCSFPLFLLLLLVCIYSGYSLLSSFVLFSIGALLAIKKVDIDKSVHGVWVLIMGVITLIIILCNVFTGLFRPYLFYMLWTAVLFLWFGYDYCYQKGFQFKCLDRYLSYTFFIYLSHIPLLNLIKSPILLLGDGQEWSYWVCYLVSPFLAIGFILLVAMLLKKRIPRFYVFITGGRV